MRITFTGDISIDKPMLAALKKKVSADGGRCILPKDFAETFQGCKEVFKSSDYVVGNLETVFGGGTSFNNKTLHYNSPDALAIALKDVGINVLTTANNHSLDEGEAGIYRTLDILDKEGILHTGTFRQGDTDRILYIEKDGIKAAIIAYTYGINACKEADDCKNIEDVCNLFQPYHRRYEGMSKAEILLRKTIFTREFGRRLRIMLKKPTVKKHVDILKESFHEKYLQRILTDLRTAKVNGADYTFICLHSGGQFNEEPGDFTLHVMDIIAKSGDCTAIIGNHPHVIQKIINEDGTLKAYSLGGLTLSPDATYVSSDAIPEYSMVLHFDVDKTGYKLSWDIMKGHADEDGYLHVVRCDDKTDNPRYKQIVERIGKTK